LRTILKSASVGRLSFVKGHQDRSGCESPTEFFDQQLEQFVGLKARMKNR